ncbi:Uncharacterised protein [Chryseobacterium nakagawai]|uniref:Uncharacterized protein n=1 Tax=Chryseobacterium nakagawai TaxID=1241982 RepID=A0AAD0YNE7_CHRNA|nr:hypothetical protein [Chryseobacterium nakagawai]AZA91764.1 hypothetical protein EG343_14640 [Chryseobacterium nakagawai]VEH18271.1 Uncharacterised protein [Chryseobacterium nakagawai]
MEFYGDSSKLDFKDYGELTLFLVSDDVFIKDVSGNLIGEFNFKELDYSKGFKLTHAYSDKYEKKFKRKGLGKAAIEYFKSSKGVDVYVSLNYEPQYDGSQLTGEGEIFVKRMIEKGVLLELN